MIFHEVTDKNKLAPSFVAHGIVLIAFVWTIALDNQWFAFSKFLSSLLEYAFTVPFSAWTHERYMCLTNVLSVIPKCFILEFSALFQKIKQVKQELTVHMSMRLMLSWLRGPVVERRSLAGVLSLSCTRPAADL